jgi:glycoprotein-N-acetylgalactosamine 3-beta-galactosyltransferase
MKSYYKQIAAISLLTAIFILTMQDDLLQVNRAYKIAQSLPSHNNNKLLFCIVLTTPANLQSGRAFAALNTWVWKCSNYRFISVIPKEVITEQLKRNQTLVDEPLNLLQPDGLEYEDYEELTLKVYNAFRDVYTQHGGYDFYMKADDDTFVNMDNLKTFLSSKDPNLAATYGYDFNFVIKNGYPAGGPGYILSKRAFHLLSEQLIANMSFCPNNGIEDMSIAQLLTNLSQNFS